MLDWSTSCPDWSDRIVAGKGLIPFPPLFPDEAEYALGVFKALRVPDLPGKPTFGECCAPWVFDFVAAIFGANDPETGKQLISEFFLCISKKNTKSTLAAGIMLTALIIGIREEEELLILAPTIEVAGNSFKPAAAMVRADDELGALLHVQDHVRTITHRVSKSSLKVVAADTDTVSGKKSGRILIDELWVFGKRPNADAMLREATGGLVSRPEGFVIYLTTQSDAPPAGVFKDKLDYARDVRDGKIDDKRFLPVLYEFPQAMLDAEAYLDPANFYITNPNIGRSVSQEWLEREMRKELAKDASTRATFLAKHLNVEIGMNLRANRWPGADYWSKRARKGLDLAEVLDRSEVVVVGVDGGGLDDLFGLAVVGRDRETKDWLAWCHAWCHDGVLERRKGIAARLRDFEREGSLTIVDDELADISAIIEIVRDVKARGLLAAVAADPAGLGEMVDALAEIDVTPENGKVIGAPQGYAMMNAIKTAERKLANGTLWHDGSALMAWCVGNIKIEPTATAIRATKANAGDAKIDPAMALFDAVTVMSRNPEAPREPQYQFMVF
ncbi:MULTISPECIES: terminase large subunit [unclassified Paracoccus (in: a-proteobacteria)]|uniref:terminase large subunit n=1 Tax=unclassified Paracoccus (in: a-proteobacteria) TaxID=2688777 RepID=UPI0012B42F6A|nr:MULTISPECIES: terminase large subunit [unclassified Paracoccus (in: a-proteobacteria)]UXU73812.1 terminase large subunit [Paracoccus sp. SMMA_5]UXU79702.1 terminase large subunit [Paracoccus sp. SMMA_5_TC]